MEVNHILMSLMKKEVIKTELISYKEGSLGPINAKND
jgi:hypothetical protein